MIRLTTPEHIFLFEEDPSAYARIRITYAQGMNIVLEKEKKDLTIDRETVDGEEKWTARLRLTQEETKRFLARDEKVRVQIRALTESGEALASEIMAIPIRDVLNDEVLTCG